MSTEIVAIIGSRKFPRLHRIREYVDTLPPGATIVSGGADGPDRMGEAAGIFRKMRVVSLRPLEIEHGVWHIRRLEWAPGVGDLNPQETIIVPTRPLRRFAEAAYYRNDLISEMCTRMAAFHDGTSRGTAHGIRITRAAGKPVEVFLSNQDALALE